jgi:cellulose synthase/poly-beta-1,6-N-acetylglucosamine synthase-like glycosyltransferase
MTATAQVIFWMCVAVIGYAYLVYPPVIFFISRCLGRRSIPSEISESGLPAVSLLIAVHNEEEVIERRIANALALDYPEDRLQIVIASDGSDDRTVEIASRYQSRVCVLDYPIRRGKAATLNAALEHLSGEIVLLSDANTSIESAALRNLVRWFGDPKIATVCGRLILVDPAGGANVDGLYWRYETFIKKCEGKLGALLGANGAIYAIRRDAIGQIPAGTIVDDFVIPLLAKLRDGRSIIYDPEAIGWEETPARLRQEFRRRARIGAGGFQAIAMLWPLLNPRRGWIAFTFFSHKVMRWVCPFFLLGALTSTGLLSGEAFYRAALLGQISFYAVSLMMGLVPSRSRILRPLRLATMFTSMNAALLFGFFQWTGGKQSGVWRRTERDSSLLRQAA